MAHISIVSPVYQAEATIQKLVEQVTAALQGLTSSMEIILVDDRSTDQSWHEIQHTCALHKHVRGIRLSRNFGQHYAISAGLQLAKGEWVVVMDCDLQDRPDQIPILYHKALQGYRIVFGSRRNRQDHAAKRIFSKAFYVVFGFLTETRQDASIANFGIYHRKVVNAIISMEDNIRYLPAMAQWVGFESTCVPVLHDARATGRSTYNLKKMLNLAGNTIISFSGKPLRLVAQGGLILSGLSFLIGCIYLVGYLTGTIKVAGYTSLMISIWLTAGLNIFVLGVVGIYIGKAFEKIKGRPLYIIDEVTGNG